MLRCHRRQSGPCLGGQVKDLAGGKGVIAVVATPDDNNRVVDTDSTVAPALCCHRRQSGPCLERQVKDLAGGTGVTAAVVPPMTIIALSTRTALCPWRCVTIGGRADQVLEVRSRT